MWEWIKRPNESFIEHVRRYSTPTAVATGVVVPESIVNHDCCCDGGVVLCSLVTLAKKPWLITDLSCLSEPLVLLLLDLIMRGLKLDRRLLHVFRATGHERVLAYVHLELSCYRVH